MVNLKDISALPSDAAELLEAVGYLDAEDLVEADIAELHTELVKANKKLHLLPEAPTEDQIRNWQESIGSAPDETPVDDEAPDESTLEEEFEPEEDRVHTFGVTSDESSNFEEDPEVLEMLEVSPEAILLPASLIKRHKLAVADIPEGILLTNCEGEVEVNILTRSRMSAVQRRVADARRTGLVASRIRGFDQADEDGQTVQPLDRGAPRESELPSEGLNEGVDPDSKRFVRGVLHPDPFSVRIAAFVSLLVQLSLAAAFIGIPWLLIYEHLSGQSMLWWVVGIAGALLLSALCYVFWGVSARCRVCGQRQFSPKKCLKNKKAHHLKLIGYIFPTAVHALFYRWFYCTYCGTAVRLKK